MKCPNRVLKRSRTRYGVRYKVNNKTGKPCPGTIRCSIDVSGCYCYTSPEVQLEFYCAECGGRFTGLPGAPTEHNLENWITQVLDTLP